MSTEQAQKMQEIVAEGVAREGLQEMVLPAEEAAAKRLADFVSDAAIDRMIATRRTPAFRCWTGQASVHSRRRGEGVLRCMDTKIPTRTTSTMTIGKAAGKVKNT